MTAQRTTLVPSNEVWSTLSDEEKQRNKRDESDRIIDCEIEDEIELVRRVDTSGPFGYRLLASPPYSDDERRMFAAAGRLCSNTSHACLEEIEPYVMIRVREFRPRVRRPREEPDARLPVTVQAQSPLLGEITLEILPAIEQVQLPISSQVVAVTDIDIEIADESIVAKKPEEPVFTLSNPDAWSLTGGGRRRRR